MQLRTLYRASSSRIERIIKRKKSRGLATSRDYILYRVCVCLCILYLPLRPSTAFLFTVCASGSRRQPVKLDQSADQSVTGVRRVALAYLRRALTSQSDPSREPSRSRFLPSPSLYRTFVPLRRAPPPSATVAAPALFLCRAVCLFLSRLYRPPFLPPSPPPPPPPPSLLTRASLSLPLKSATSAVSSLRDFTCSRVHYGRLQVSRMQAIKCVVVGDGYVRTHNRRLVEIRGRSRSAENLGEKDPRHRRRRRRRSSPQELNSRRANRVVGRSGASRCLPSIRFPVCERGVRHASAHHARAGTVKRR